MSKPIPKSLHTVTVITAIARAARQRTAEQGKHLPDAEFVNYALRLLDLDNMPDDHAIVAQCLKQLNRKG